VSSRPEVNEFLLNLQSFHSEGTRTVLITFFFENICVDNLAVSNTGNWRIISTIAYCNLVKFRQQFSQGDLLSWDHLNMTSLELYNCV
jgi:hypothetical protein